MLYVLAFAAGALARHFAPAAYAKARDRYDEWKSRHLH